MKLTDDIKNVFVEDEYGGVECWKLDWSQDVVWCRGELYDQYETIEEAFWDNNIYPTVIDCHKHTNRYTEFK